VKQPETLLKERVLKFLRTLPNTWFVKVQQQTIRGTPDILACCNGHFVALELKRDGTTKPDDLQVYTLAKISASGGVAMVVHPGNLNDCKKLLKEMVA